MVLGATLRVTSRYRNVEVIQVAFDCFSFKIHPTVLLSLKPGQQVR